jgi:pimeloyl-ACP methyl ester carboxylesterase
MKKLLLIFSFLPLFLSSQNSSIYQLVYEDRLDKSDTLGISYREVSVENEKKSFITISPYPIIFIHGLSGTGSSWNPFGVHINQNANFSWGGELEFCLENYNFSTPQDACQIPSDILSFIPSSLPVADYYRIEFDCYWDGTCNNNNSEWLLSNQAAITKQGYALGIAIDKVLNATGKNKIILVGHSMGGLAAREYVQNSSHWIGNSHRVAKLVTSGTPHGGSNSTSLGIGLGGINEKSEAVRDLRESYTSGHLGAYLVGGIPESDSYIWNNLFWDYKNVDVTCDGDENDFITGLNFKSIPYDIDYVSIASSYSGNDDGVVDYYNANLSNYKFTPYFEFFNANNYVHSASLMLTNPSATGHLTEANYINFKSLDEPDNKDMAYDIDLGNAYTGFLTFQGDYMPNRDYDEDYYRFSVNQLSYVLVSVSNLPTNSYVSLLSSQNTIITQTGPNVFFSSFVSPGVYYIKIEGAAYGNTIPGSYPWQKPYSFLIDYSLVNSVFDEYLSKERSLIKSVDVLGRESNNQHQPLFYIYDDGTVEKRIVVE